MRAIIFFLTMGAASVLAQTAQQGYVVRSDADGVYIDYGATSGVHAGQAFTVYKEGAELIHPVTKASLGRIETVVAKGTIAEVHPGYSKAALTSGKPGEVPVGARVRLEAPVASAPSEAPAAPAQVQAPAAPAGTAEHAQDGEDEPAAKAKGRKPRWESPAFDYLVSGMAVGDFNGDGALELALADDRRVHLYAYPPKDATSKADFKYPGNSPRIISLETADLNGNGRSELFVTSHDQNFPRVETLVLEVDASGQWSKVGELPWIVRSRQGPKGERLLMVQQLLDNQSFPFSTIFSLEYRDGKYGKGGEALRFKRVDWIYDLATVYPAGEDAMPVFFTANDRIRADLKKGSWKSPQAFAQTPIRVRWMDRLLQCRPSLLISYDAQGAPSLYAARNIARFGGLAQPFGLYARGELVKLKWTGLGFQETEKFDLEGYVAAQTWVPAAQGGKPEVALAADGTTGNSIVYGFQP